MIAVLVDSKGETGSIRPGRSKHATGGSARSESRTVEPVEGFGVRCGPVYVVVYGEPVEGFGEGYDV